MNTKTSWMDTKWRPAMGWTYMAICILDFAVFPIMWSILQAIANGRVETQWDPITLRGAGLFHMAMGAIVGVTAWSRGQEKMAVLTTPAPQPINSHTLPLDPPRNTRND